MLDKIKLTAPSVGYAEQIMQLKQELIDANDASSFAGCGTLKSCSDAFEWIEKLHLMQNPATCPAELVPSTTFLAVRESDDAVVGVTDLRHHIDHPVLSVWGGHIGYSVSPSQRKHGYAAQMLSLRLEECRKLGLRSVLITCNSDNTASERTILKNGGVFEGEVSVEGETVKRFWVPLREQLSAGEMWARYRAASGVRNEKYEAWQYGSVPDKLADLTERGIKTATASPFPLYAAENEPLPKVGDYSVILDSRGYAVCVIQTVRVRVVPFCQVDERQAYLEGEGDRTLEYWRSVHSQVFSTVLPAAGLVFDENTGVVCEEFELLFK